MSKIGQHVIELQEQNGVESLDEMEAKELSINDIPEAEMREWDLSKYSTDELEAEIDRRTAENSPYKHTLKSVYFPDTIEWLDEAIAKLHPDRNDKAPF